VSISESIKEVHKDTLPKVIYLGCPYSGTPETQEWRFQTINHISGVLMTLGNVVFSPISHSHPIQTHPLSRTESTYNFWVNGQDLHILRRCDILAVCRLPGWERSIGLQAEITMARAWDIKIVHLVPRFKMDGSYGLHVDKLYQTY
jgi:hypothetical protein